MSCTRVYSEALHRSSFRILGLTTHARTISCSRRSEGGGFGRADVERAQQGLVVLCQVPHVTTT